MSKVRTSAYSVVLIEASEVALIDDNYNLVAMRVMRYRCVVINAMEQRQMVAAGGGKVSAIEKPGVNL